MSRVILPSHECKNTETTYIRSSLVCNIYVFRFCWRSRRNNARFISEIFSRWSFRGMVVLNPSANPLDMFGADDAARCAASSPGDGEVLHRTMSLASCAIARGITTGSRSARPESRGGSPSPAAAVLPVPACADARRVGKAGSVRYLPSPECKFTPPQSMLYNRCESADMRTSPYLTDSEGNRFAVRSSWVTSGLVQARLSPENGPSASFD